MKEQHGLRYYIIFIHANLPFFIFIKNEHPQTPSKLILIIFNKMRLNK